MKVYMRLDNCCVESDLDNSITPEEILLQITLAFMVFLGYLLSNQVEQQAAITDRIVHVHAVVQSILNADKGDITRELALSNIRNQKLELLKCWEQSKQTNVFFRRVADFRLSGQGREAGPLASIDIDRKVTNEGFQRLCKETTRLFLGDGKENPQIDEEVLRCFFHCVHNAGFNPVRTEAWVPDALKRTALWKSFELIAQTDRSRSKSLAPESQQFIIDTIETDFRVAREGVAAIQTDGALQLAIHRLEKEPVPVSPSVTSLYAPEILKRLFKNADEQLHLLPEVKSSLHQSLGRQIGNPPPQLVR